MCKIPTATRHCTTHANSVIRDVCVPCSRRTVQPQRCARVTSKAKRLQTWRASMGRQRLCRFFVERECERECLDRSLSNGIGFTSSKDCPFTPFTFTIQPIKRRHSAARFCTLRWCIPKLLSSRFSLASGVRDPLALVVNYCRRHRHQSCITNRALIRTFFSLR